MRVGLPLLLVAAAATVGAVLIQTPPGVEKAAPTEVQAVVAVSPLTSADALVSIEAFGTVLAARQVPLQPEVGGRVVHVHEALVPGGLIGAGETLIRIDPSDYEIALTESRADVEVARLTIDRLRARVEVLDRQAAEIEARLGYLEWNADRLARLSEHDHVAQVEAREVASQVTAEKAALAGLRAQIVEQDKAIEGAQAQAEVAKSRLAAAELALSRTEVVAPFDAIVLSESVEVGQLISPQAAVATLAATEAFWVEAAVPVVRVKDIRFASSDPAAASRARVSLATGFGGSGEAPVAREGVVLRLLGDLDPRGRMARLIIAIPDPLDLESATGGFDDAILIGSYVRISIDAGVMKDVYTIPRRALRENDRVWVRDAEGRFAVRPVHIVWRRQDDVLVRDGFAPGDELITSHLASVVPGMPLDIRRSPLDESPPPSPSTEVDAR